VFTNPLSEDAHQAAGDSGQGAFDDPASGQDLEAELAGTFGHDPDAEAERGDDRSSGRLA
jgi:hypothetical protein